MGGKNATFCRADKSFEGILRAVGAFFRFKHEYWDGRLHGTPRPHTCDVYLDLNQGGGANWDVLGTFNLHPALLSNLVSTAGQAGSHRLLWEWRASRMPVKRKLADLARWPYYVVARIPASLLEALVRRQGFTKPRVEQLLSVLGLRGIGLAALNAHAGTGESAAAGFFYALQLLTPPSGLNPLTAGTLVVRRPIGWSSPTSRWTTVAGIVTMT